MTNKNAQPEVQVTQQMPISGEHVGHNFQTQVDISKEDVIQVAVDEIETKLEEALSSQQSELRIAEQMTKEARDKYKDELEKFSNKEVKKVSNSFVKGVRSSVGALEGDEGKTWELNVTSQQITDKEKGKCMEFDLSYKSKTFNASFSFVVPITEKLINLASRVKALLDEEEILAGNIAKIRSRLRDIPKTERKARAALAKASLQDTGAGKGMLDVLNNTDFLGADIRRMVGLPTSSSKAKK